jgi:thymidine phosphorylase
VGQSDSEREISGLLDSGKVWKVFIHHIEAQGASVDALTKVLDSSSVRRMLTLSAAADGFWIPPPMHVVKDWLKQEQMRLDEVGLRGRVGGDQIGFRLLVAPGDRVEKGQAVAKVMVPPNIDVMFDRELLQGAVTKVSSPLAEQILEVVWRA